MPSDHVDGEDAENGVDDVHHSVHGNFSRCKNNRENYSVLIGGQIASVMNSKRKLLSDSIQPADILYLLNYAEP